MKPNKIFLLCLFLGACSTAEVSNNVASTSASEAYKKGLLSFKKKDFDTAIGYFEKAQQDETLKAQAMAAEGAVLWAMEDYKKIVEVMGPYVASDGMFDVDSKIRLGEAYKMLGNEEASMKIFKQVILMQPNNAQGLFNQAQLLIKKNRFDEAMAAVTKLLDLRPNYIEGILLRAEIYEKTKKFPQAIEDYKVVSNTDVQFSEAFQGLVRIYNLKDDVNKTYEYVNLWMIRDNSNPAVYEAKADILKKMNRKSEAQAVYGEMIAKFPDTNTYRAELVELMMEIKDYNSAKDQIDIILKSSPWHKQANYYLGKYYVDRQNLAEAGKLFKKLYDHDPSQEWVVMSYSKILDRVNEAELSRKIVFTFNQMKNAPIDMQQAVATVDTQATGVAPVTIVADTETRDVASMGDQKYTTVVVQKGDSLKSISRTAYGTVKRWNEIYELNKSVIRNPQSLDIGAELKIPQK